MKQKFLLKTMLLLCLMMVGVGNAWAETKSVDITPSQALNDGGVSPITIVCAKGDGTSAPAISSGQLRLYQAASGKTTGNTMTFSSEKTITSIVFTFANSMTADNGVFSEGSYDSSTSTWSGSTNSVTLTVTGTKSSERIYITALTVYYEDGNGGGDQPTKDDCDLALTGAPVALTFDLYNNSGDQVIYYSTSSTGEVTVSSSEYVDTEVDEGTKTITVTPKKKTNGAQEITVSQAADDDYNAGSATFTVTIGDSTPKTGGWVLTNLADLTEDDVFVIVGNNGDTYAMSNDNGASSAPTAVAVTIEDDEITGDVAENILWNISYNSATETYTLYPNGSTETWLYCTNSNNGVRVGTNENKSFKIKDDYLFNVETSTYLGIYSSQDWRRYGSINSNISGQTFAFYKYEDNNATTVKAPVITVDATFIGSTTATITCATEGATIYYSYNGEDWTEYTDALTITQTTTIYAKAVLGEDESTVVSKTTTKTLPTPTVAIDATGITNTNVYEGTAAGSLAATVTYNDAAIEGATVAWSGNNDEVATIDDATGAVTLVAAGSVTFTATFAGNDDFNGATATYVMTVTNTDPNAPGTENNPYTVAEARAAIDANAGVTGVYAMGKVSAIVTEYSSQYKNITFDISSDGTDSSEQLRAYRCVGTASTDASDVKVGDDVVIYGDLTLYDGSIYEFKQNCQLVSLTRPADTTPSITVNTNSIEATADGADGTITVTYNNITDVAAEVYFCDANGNTATYDWLTAVINGENNVEYIIDANEGAARTAYLKVYALDDNTEDVYSGLITITQAAYVAPFVPATYSLATTITSGKHYIITDGEDKAMGLQNNNNRADADVEIENGVATVSSADVYEFVIQGPDANGNYTIYDVANSGYLYAASNSSNHLKNEAALDNNNNGKWSIEFDGNGVATIKAKGSNSRNWMRYNSSDDIFSCYGATSSQADIYLYEKEGEATPTETVTITDAKYATYCSENALDFEGTGLTAYIAKTDGTTVEFTPVTKVPAYTGVLLKAENAGDVIVNASSSVDDVTGNVFIGVTEQKTINEPGIFVLMKGDWDGGKGVGFYKTQNAFTVGAHTAYLPASAGESRSFIGFDDVTAVKGIVADAEATGEIYNLQGQRVVKAQKGLYIMNGKKVLVK